MAQANINVLLKGGVTHDGLHFYDPGGLVTGEVEVISAGPLTCRALKVALMWQTEGKGDRDTKVEAETICFQGPIPLGLSRFPFELRLPDVPWSFTGRYVSYSWVATATLELDHLKILGSYPQGGKHFFMMPTDLLAPPEISFAAGNEDRYDLVLVHSTGKITPEDLRKVVRLAGPLLGKHLTFSESNLPIVLPATILKDVPLELAVSIKAAVERTKAKVEIRHPDGTVVTGV